MRRRHVWDLDERGRLRRRAPQLHEIEVDERWYEILIGKLAWGVCYVVAKFLR